MPDLDFDRIQPAALDMAPLASAPAAQLPAAQARSTSLGAFAVLGALLLLAAGVFFVLPDLLAPPASAPAAATTATNTPGAPTTSPAAKTAAAAAPATSAVQSPWEQAQSDRERAAAKTALDALLSLQYELQERKTDTWAKADFGAAIALAQQGDAAYRESRFTDATARYREGETALRALRDGIPARLEARLAAGDAAFAAGDQATALAAFAEAAAIEPAEVRARAGLERARKLDQLAAGLASGKTQESAGQFEQAAASYREALTLDNGWEPARQALAAVEARITGERSAARMSAGYAALAAGRLEDARKEFQAAIPLGGGSAAREGLQQAEFQMGQQRIGTLLRAAEEAERAEDWKRALAQYESALAVDPALGSASTGRDRARTRLALDEALARLSAEPGKLANDTARKAADTLVASAAAIPEPGTRLTAQIAAARQALASMRTALPVQLRSDGKTDVIVFRVGSLGSFTGKELSLLPGDYVAVGRRDGFRDVRVEFSLRPGQTTAPVVVQCGQKI